jgi:hypothetical protein
MKEMMLSAEELLNSYFLPVIMKKNYLKLLVVTLGFTSLVLTIASCNQTTSAPIIPLKAGEMQATVSGLGSFYATNTKLTTGDIIYTIDGSIDNDSLGITIAVTKQAATPYTINTSNDINSSIVYCILQPDGTCVKYIAENGLGSASITISDITSPDVQGSFSGTLKTPDGTGTITISNGSFNAY